MDDYEHTNALEWDLNKGGGRSTQASEESWEVVGGSKKPQKAPARPQPFQNKSNQRGARDRSQQKQTLPFSGGRYQGLQLTGAQQQTSTNSSHENRQQRQASGSSHFHVPSGSQSRPDPLQGQNRSPPKWPKQELRQRNRPRRPPRMAHGSDNLGELQWRTREEAKSQIRIPIILVAKDKGHQTIAKHHGTFIFSEGGLHGHGSADFGIWGDMKAVSATVDDINAWIKEWRSSGQKKGNGKFAKVCSLTPKLRERAERDWEKEVKKHRYRQYPPPDKAFDAIGSFHWPVEEYKPEEVLGSSYEALDAIRMDCKCYVVFNKEQGLFQIMGKAALVKDGLMRLRGVYFQIIARTISLLELCLVHDAREYVGNVVLKEYDRIRSITGVSDTEGRMACAPRLEDCGSRSSWDPASETKLARSVLGTLPKLHYYHGSIKMRARLGTFLATQYMRTQSGVYSTDQYRTMIRQSAFRGEVTQELGDKLIENETLSVLRDATDFLSPQDPMISDLASIKPLYTAIFIFADPNNSELGDICLTITWETHQDSNSTNQVFEQVSKKWTRLDRDTGSASSILDICLCELRTSMAWQFEIHAAQTIEEDRLPSGFTSYGDSIKPDPKAALKSAVPSATEISFVNFRSSFAHLKSVEQRLSYRYGLIGSDYTLELSRFQLRTYPPRKLSVLSQPEPTIYEARWGLSFYRIEWHTMFTKNERLPIGEKADWSDDEHVWFPKDFDGAEGGCEGFKGMLEKLKVVQKLVMEAEAETGEEDLIGGMAVG